MRAKVICALAGIALGVALGVGVPSVWAQGARLPVPTYRECFAVTVGTVSGREIARGRLPSSFVAVPRGWTVVGGAGAQTGAAMLLCR